ncbi:MAG: glycosyltransferase family 2 protein [Kiritimatiellae bacterium]|nr:glycosyltransferase family 2 protein [Kiritimatiellia bacterium]
MSALLERAKIRLNRVVRRAVSSLRLRYRSGTPIPASRKDEVLLFMEVRNESLRLPAVLDDHFSKGASRAFIVDNGSTDGTVEFLLKDKRVHLFSTNEHFHGALAWLEVLLRRFGCGQWCLVLDADELLAYPHMDTLDLPGFAAYLDAQGFEALHCLFLDMYPPGPLNELRYRPGDDLLAHAMCFDADNYSRMPFRGIFSDRAPAHVLCGGVRQRVFGEEFGCSKYPFFRYHKGVFLRLGLHTVEGLRIAPEQGVLMHFKFLQDFHANAVREAARGVHWNGAVEYKAYARMIEQHPSFVMANDRSQRFRDWRQLVELGLMASSPALDAHAVQPRRDKNERKNEKNAV